MTRSPWWACGLAVLQVLQVEGRGDAFASSSSRSRSRSRSRVRQAIRLQLAVGYGLGWLSQQLNAATGDDPSVRYASVDDGPSLVRGQPRREEARKGDEFLKGGGFPMVAEGGGRRPQFLVVRCNGWAVSSGAAVLRRYLGWRWRGPQGTAAGCNSDGMKCHTANGTRFVLVVTLGMTDRWCAWFGLL